MTQYKAIKSMKLVYSIWPINGDVLIGLPSIIIIAMYCRSRQMTYWHDDTGLSGAPFRRNSYGTCENETIPNQLLIYLSHICIVRSSCYLILFPQQSFLQLGLDRLRFAKSLQLQGKFLQKNMFNFINIIQKNIGNLKKIIG